MPLTSAQADLAAEHISLVRTEAWSYFKHSTGMDLDDCMSAGMLGLTQATASWPRYCAEHDGYDAGRLDYYRAYCLRRIRGAIRDQARANDHMTRSARGKVRAVRQAEDDGARTDEEKAAATGLSVATVQRVRADALVTLSLDDHPEVEGYSGGNLADDTAEGDVEGQAAVHDLLSRFMSVFDRLAPEVQVILAMRFHGELELEVIAGMLRTTGKRVAELHDAGVLELHRALLAAVS